PATPEVVARTEKLLRQLADHVSGDPAVCEVARLMRLPGSDNTKNGDRPPARIMARQPLHYALGDLEELLSEAAPGFGPRKGAAPAGNACVAVDVPEAGGPAVDVEARLAGMRHQGPGDRSIHATQLAVSAALLNRGVSVDEIVATMLAATRSAAGDVGAR